MNATTLIAANGMAAGHCMSGVPGSPAWAEATVPDDVRAGLETPELAHEGDLPDGGMMAMTPHGMMPTGHSEAGPRRYEMRFFFKSLRFFGNYHVPCLSPRHGTSREMLYSPLRDVL